MQDNARYNETIERHNAAHRVVHAAPLARLISRRSSSGTAKIRGNYPSFKIAGNQVLPPPLQWPLPRICGRGRTLYTQKFAGQNLLEHLNRKTLDAQALRAAARELRRAHGLRCDEFAGGLWSHGDPHLGNVVYDETADRARLVDFEILPRNHFPLLKDTRTICSFFLQDLAGRVSRGKMVATGVLFCHNLWKG